MNVKQRQSNKYISILSYLTRKLRQVQNRKRFNLFWNKLSNKDRIRVVLLVGIKNQPVPSLTHLKAMLALAKYYYKEKWIYGGLE